MPRLRLALAQTNPVVGDLVGNVEAVVAAARAARDAGADILLAGEMVVSGYPIEDLAAQPSFLRQAHAAVPALATRLQEEGLGDLLVIVGYPDGPFEPRLLGSYHDGLGNHWQDPHALRLHDHGRANLPYLSDGMWFMTQFRRWGLLRDDPDYLGVARQVQQLALYGEAAQSLGVACPEQPMRSSLRAEKLMPAAQLSGMPSRSALP